jgi:hypothetical protein
MFMLFGCFVGLIVCAVFLGTFVTESGVFVISENNNTPYKYKQQEAKEKRTCEHELPK